MVLSLPFQCSTKSANFLIFLLEIMISKRREKKKHSFSSQTFIISAVCWRWWHGSLYCIVWSIWLLWQSTLFTNWCRERKWASKDQCLLSGTVFDTSHNIVQTRGPPLFSEKDLVLQQNLSGHSRHTVGCKKSSMQETKGNLFWYVSVFVSGVCFSWVPFFFRERVCCLLGTAGGIFS